MKRDLAGISEKCWQFCLCFFLYSNLLVRIMNHNYLEMFTHLYNHHIFSMFDHLNPSTKKFTMLQKTHSKLCVKKESFSCKNNIFWNLMMNPLKKMLPAGRGTPRHGRGKGTDPPLIYPTKMKMYSVFFNHIHSVSYWLSNYRCCISPLFKNVKVFIKTTFTE